LQARAPDDQWKVYWRIEGGGATRDNIEAWCLECFDSNFEAPRETVALLAPDIVDYARLVEEDQRRAITLKSVLRDAAKPVATKYSGRLVIRRDDDVLVEFATSREAVEAARSLFSGFREITLRLDLSVPELRAAIHCGEVTRWRNGLLAADAVKITTSLLSMARAGQIWLTGPAVASLKTSGELEPITEDATVGLPPVGGIWALPL